ncbi:MAG: hypothetical protein IPN96_09455 [Anaerolineales bacterium]|nr:hypothetical protein [Anaerolineales bacterium]
MKSSLKKTLMFTLTLLALIFSTGYPPQRRRLLPLKLRQLLKRRLYCNSPPADISSASAWMACMPPRAVMRCMWIS